MQLSDEFISKRNYARSYKNSNRNEQEGIACNSRNKRRYPRVKLCENSGESVKISNDFSGLSCRHLSFHHLSPFKTCGYIDRRKQKPNKGNSERQDNSARKNENYIIFSSAIRGNRHSKNITDKINHLSSPSLQVLKACDV